jgi:threonine synthase
MAAYAARAGLKAIVFIPSGQIALGKLSQALDYGARVLQIDGDFDEAMRVVREVTRETDLYLLNSMNPFRLEGQKTIAFELLQQRQWRVPDRIVVPGGNLGNSSAIAKGLRELLDCGVIPRMPRLTIVQAEGANPLYRMWTAEAAQLEPVRGPGRWRRRSESAPLSRGKGPSRSLMERRQCRRGERRRDR